ncbi:hypothetical protein ACUOA8_07090, partial [Escherichia sp. SS-MK2]
IKAAKLRGDALDHLLIFGPPGLGKTMRDLLLNKTFILIANVSPCVRQFGSR